MRIFLPILALFVFGMGVQAQPSSLSTNNVIVSFPVTGVRSVTVQRVNSFVLSGNFYPNPPVTASVNTQSNNFANNYCIFSNLICGPVYEVTFSGYSTWKTNFCIPSTENPDLNGNVSAMMWASVYNPQIGFNAYVNSHTTNYNINYTVTNGGGGSPLASSATASIRTVGGTNFVDVTNVPAAIVTGAPWLTSVPATATNHFALTNDTTWFDANGAGAAAAAAGTNFTIASWLLSPRRVMSVTFSSAADNNRI